MITRRFVLIALLFGVTLFALLTWNPGGAVVQIEVEPSGTAHIGGAKLDMQTLEVNLRERVENNPGVVILGVVILIVAEKDTPAGHVMQIMDVARQAGAVNIEINAGP